MENTAISDKESEAIRLRLIAIRKFAVGENQAEFARRLEISPTRWNNLERGWPLTLKLAFLIMKRVQGVTVSYITEGDVSRVPVSVRRQLGAYVRELEAELSSSSRRSAKR